MCSVHERTELLNNPRQPSDKADPQNALMSLQGNVSLRCFMIFRFVAVASNSC